MTNKNKIIGMRVKSQDMKKIETACKITGRSKANLVRKATMEYITKLIEENER